VERRHDGLRRFARAKGLPERLLGLLHSTRRRANRNRPNGSSAPPGIRTDPRGTGTVVQRSRLFPVSSTTKPRGIYLELGGLRSKPEQRGWDLGLSTSSCSSQREDRGSRLACPQQDSVSVLISKGFDLAAREAYEGGVQLDGFGVTPEMLVLSGMIECRPDLEGTSFSTLLDRIGPWHDRAAARVVSDQFPVDLGDYEQGLELAAVANLIDLAVHRIFSADILSLRGSAERREHEASDA
jgi:hypothetical protein